MSWIRIRELGRGSFGTVCLAKFLYTNKEFAVKSAEFNQSISLQREQQILSKLNCPRIVKYIGYDITVENGQVLYNLHLEYARGGSFVDFMRTRRDIYPEENMIRVCTRAIVEALVYIHAMGIVHCDIACRNILITDEGPKLADFGLARKVDSKISMLANRLFNAPEVARGVYEFPAEIWSLGCTVIEMTTGRDPDNGVPDSLLNPVRLGHMNNGNVPQIPPCLSEQGQNFLKCCLRRDPSQRLSASQLLCHPFLQIPLNIVNFVFPTPSSINPNFGMFFI